MWPFQKFRYSEELALLVLHQANYDVESVISKLKYSVDSFFKVVNGDPKWASLDAEAPLV